MEISKISVQDRRDHEHVLPASLDLEAAEALQAELRTRLADRRNIRIDGSHVERISTACLQLLTAAAIAGRNAGYKLEIATPSDVLSDAVRDLGLSTVLGMDNN